MNGEIRILLVEDDPADVELTREELRNGGLNFALERVFNQEQFLLALESHRPQVILSDYSLPTFDGVTALNMVQKLYPDIPFIFVTGTMGEEVAIETLKQGATDYVLKTRLSRLVPSVHRALREAEDRTVRKRAEAQLRESHEQLRALSVYLQYVREEERTRIAREVHDELGQALTSLKMDLSWVSSRLPRDLRPVLEKTRRMSNHIDSTIQTVRRISTELRPGVLDDLGLVPAIEWQAHEFERRTEIACRVEADVTEGVLDRDLNTAFFRIFQETLTNVIRHAEATRVDVTLHEAEGRLVMRVQDNGRGIAPTQAVNTRSIGLLGMRERAALLGGEFRIEGAPGKGTTVTVSIPRKTRPEGGIVSNENPNRRRPRSSAARAQANPRR